MITHRILINGDVLEICVEAGLTVHKEEGRVTITHSRPAPTVEHDGIHGIAVPIDSARPKRQYLSAA